MPVSGITGEMSFLNPILIDIFSRYADNSTMAGFVGEDGMIKLRFRVDEEFESPKSCEQLLSLLYALLESNPGLPMGKVYSENQCGILRETVYRLYMVLDGFSNVKLSLINGSSRTEFTLTRSKSVTTDN